MKNFNGKILFLDRSDINTDEIIPARYLTEATKEALTPYCLEDLNLPGFNAKTDLTDKAVIVTRSNFGCGSSREHAPWVLQYNNINLVIAENFARIFRQNMFNCGLMAVSLSKENIEEIFATFANSVADCKTNLNSQKLTISNDKITKEYSFTISPFDMELVKAGGWLNFADKKY